MIRIFIRKDNSSSLQVVDWYKDEQPSTKLKYEVELSLNDNLTESYDKAAFDSKVSLLMNHFVDMAVQGIWLDWYSIITYKKMTTLEQINTLVWSFCFLSSV